MPRFSITTGWSNLSNIYPNRFVCGYCGSFVTSEKGYAISNQRGAGVYICPGCAGPNCFAEDRQQFPAPALGNNVKNIPSELNDVYEEARTCTSHGAYTAAVMLLRKMLMCIAVEHGASEGATFTYYVDWMVDNDVVQKKAKPWVEQIKKVGNSANHKVEPKSKDDAEQLLRFTEMILKTNYELVILT